MVISSRTAAYLSLKNIIKDIAEGVFKKPNSGDPAYRSYNYLIKQKVIELREIEDVTEIILTENGKKKLLRYKANEMSLKNTEKWDGIWRIVAFDIPEKLKVNRNSFNFKLKELGFIKYQNSVFITPYKCKEEIKFLRNYYEIAPFVRYIEASIVDNEEMLRHAFNLPQNML